MPLPANTWMMYDAFTGNYICSIANVSSGGTASTAKTEAYYDTALSGTGANTAFDCVEHNPSYLVERYPAAMYQNGDYSDFQAITIGCGDLA